MRGIAAGVRAVASLRCQTPSGRPATAQPVRFASSPSFVSAPPAHPTASSPFELSNSPAGQRSSARPKSQSAPHKKRGVLAQRLTSMQRLFVKKLLKGANLAKSRVYFFLRERARCLRRLTQRPQHQLWEQRKPHESHIARIRSFGTKPRSPKRRRRPLARSFPDPW